jgi:hypothetical protein
MAKIDDFLAFLWQFVDTFKKKKLVNLFFVL